ncbi:unnamed protein product [Chrysoparadoxa australica]
MVFGDPSFFPNTQQTSLKASDSTSALPKRELLKIIVLGSSNAGKTSIMKRYVGNDFDPRRRATVGADFMTKELKVGEDWVLLQVWDTAGQERFAHSTLGSGFYRGAAAALLVYDLSDNHSFGQVAMWREELLSRLPEKDASDSFPVVVIGNKLDLVSPGREAVDTEAVRHWCNTKGMGYLETSAKDGTGVAAAMEACAVLALQEKRRQIRERADEGRLDLTLPTQRRQQEGQCCQ